MPDLARELFKHKLPVKEGYKPHKQSLRRFDPQLMSQTKAKLETLLKESLI